MSAHSSATSRNDTADTVSRRFDSHSSRTVTSLPALKGSRPLQASSLCEARLMYPECAPGLLPGCSQVPTEYVERVPHGAPGAHQGPGPLTDKAELVVASSTG